MAAITRQGDRRRCRGGNRESDAVYVNAIRKANDGITPYVLKVKDVRADGFWSVSAYNGEGYFDKNVANAYSYSKVTKKKDDGSIIIHLGRDLKQSNFIPNTKGWI